MIAEIITIVGALMIVVNIITEIAKKLGLNQTNLFVVILSEVLTLICFFAWVDVNQISVEWYYVVGALFVGLCVAYAAMFGYDKLKQALLQIKNIKE